MGELVPKKIVVVGSPGCGKTTYFIALMAHALGARRVGLRPADDETKERLDALVHHYLSTGQFPPATDFEQPHRYELVSRGKVVALVDVPDIKGGTFNLLYDTRLAKEEEQARKLIEDVKAADGLIVMFSTNDVFGEVQRAFQNTLNWFNEKGVQDGRRVAIVMTQSEQFFGEESPDGERFVRRPSYPKGRRHDSGHTTVVPAPNEFATEYDAVDPIEYFQKECGERVLNMVGYAHTYAGNYGEHWFAFATSAVGLVAEGHGASQVWVPNVVANHDGDLVVRSPGLVRHVRLLEPLLYVLDGELPTGIADGKPRAPAPAPRAAARPAPSALERDSSPRAAPLVTSVRPPAVQVTGTPTPTPGQFEERPVRTRPPRVPPMAVLVGVLVFGLVMIVLTLASRLGN